MNQQFLEELRHIVGEGRLREHEPMGRHTTFRVGGPADAMVWPEYGSIPKVLRLCREYGQSYCILGNGSNLLVGDKGIRGLVIGMSARDARMQTEGNSLIAGAGALLSKIAAAAASDRLSGMEFAAGIPGSVGGAIVMNAGAYGGEMKDIVESVRVLDADGQEKILSADALAFGYRKSCIPQNGYIVTEITLRLSPGNEKEILSRMEDLKEQRQAKQPLEYPSAGSTFKRPEGHFAGKLIMDAGLRGYQIGGAQVSEKHCGFIINKGGATADDICRLMREVTARVQEKTGILLEPEVRLLGEFA